MFTVLPQLLGHRLLPVQVREQSDVLRPEPEHREPERQRVRQLPAVWSDGAGVLHPLHRAVGPCGPSPSQLRPHAAGGNHLHSHHLPRPLRPSV